MENEGLKQSDRDKRTSIHPVAYPVNKVAKKDTALDVARRTAFIGAISAGIAMLVKRALYPKLLEIQPENLPVALPPETGFFTAGSAITAIALAARKEKVSTRRCFFYTLAAGLGAVIGSTLGNTVSRPNPGSAIKPLDESDTDTSKVEP